MGLSQLERFRQPLFQGCSIGVGVPVHSHDALPVPSVQHGPMRHNPIIQKLQSGSEVTFRPRGNSMVPLIHSGDQVTLEPLNEEHVLEEGTIVYVLVSGTVYLHLIRAISGNRFQIGNTRGGINGWVGREKIYGVLKKAQIPPKA